MRIFIDKKIIKTSDKNEKIYTINKIENCCKEMENLLSSGFLSIVNGNIESNVHNFIQDNDEDNNFFVGIVSSSFEDDGDYNYDETEWIPFYNEYNSYYKILKCPICGENIEFIMKEIDISKEYQDILNRFPKNKKTKANKELIKKLQKELDNLMRGSFYEI